MNQLRAAWPEVQIVVRADAGYSIPSLLTFFEDEGLEYVVGYARNPVLERRSQLWQNYAQACAALYDEPCCVFTEFSDYQSQSWDGPRRMIAKCEVTAQGGPNRRFVVTNLAVIAVTPQGLVLRETAPGVSVDEVQAATGARLIVPPDLKEMEL